MITVDSYFYGRTTVSFWNIIYYNIISPLGGPELYGTESSTFYIANLLLNFNVLLPLALISLPGLLVTMQYDKRRLGRHQRDAKPDESSPYALLAVRLAPFYLWLAVLSLQPHKEERFMYPAYPLLAMNAAVGLYLIKGWTEQAYIKYTKSSYKVRTPTHTSPRTSMYELNDRPLKLSCSPTSPSSLSSSPPSSPSDASTRCTGSTTPRSIWASTSRLAQYPPSCPPSAIPPSSRTLRPRRAK